MKDNEKKNQNTEGQQEQTPEKTEGFFKRTVKRFGRDLLKIVGGVAIGAVVTAAVFKARSEKTVDEETEEDQETEDEEDVSEEDSEE
jgi:hypothetical protein